MKYIKSAISISTIALLYIIISVYIGNFELINKTISGTYPYDFKIKILTGIYMGLPYTHSSIQFISILLISILTGLNINLISKRIAYLRHKGKLHFMVGGSMILGLATGGCAVCGLPLLALLGLSGAAALLPFEGNEFSFLSIFLLAISLFILIKNSKESESCKIKPKKSIRKNRKYKLIPK